MIRYITLTVFFSFSLLACDSTQGESSDIELQQQSVLAAKPAELPRHAEPYTWNSGVLDGASVAGSNALATAVLASREVVSIPGSPWMQLKFRDVVLGSGSYIEMRSLFDNATQRLDAMTLKQWGHRSAFFNGDAVEVQVFVSPQDSGVFVEIFEIVVGEQAVRAESICGVDDRVASNEPRVARIDPIGCTGWIIDNGKHLSAGHCLAGNGNNILSFNPPPSLPDGTVQFPGPEDQYSIDQSSFEFVNGGIGNDWGIFAVFDNATTGVQPIDVQGAFRIKQDLGPANIRITGFGVDSGTTNQTNQTHVGPNAGSSGTTMRYRADTRGGNSGSPVIDAATGEAVGIHTHGGCGGSGGNNHGTSFFNSALFTAIGASNPGPGIDCPAGSIDFNSLSLTSYSNQNVTNSTTVEDNGDILLLKGNTWVRSTRTFTITRNTVLDFQFASKAEGEIHAIGFDENDTLNDAPRHFQFFGTQNWTGTGKIDLSPKYSGNGEFQSYSIPIGQNYTGTMRLVFTNDKDRGTLNNEGRFACVQIR
ncbi:MAG: serine protease [Proteobacteria bacterium]|nr:serine protease [Pseudomonadota bacterium]